MKNTPNLWQVSELKLTYHHKVKPSERPRVDSPEKVYNILLQNWSDQIEFVEEFNILLLNRANRVLGLANISKGGLSSTIVDAKVIFATALKAKASSIILAHNHPSGQLHPSQADKDITKKLVEIGKVLELPVLDHLIITPDGYYSFQEHDML